MEVVGYKIFNSDFTNYHGKKFEVGKIYTVEGKVKFGTKGNGFHLCKNIEDTFRYNDAIKKGVKICYVKGSGDIVESFDDYYGYYDMFVARQIEILKLLSREEIINIGLELNELRAERFVSGFKLTEEEIRRFQSRFSKYERVLEAIEYYQKNNMTYDNNQNKTLKYFIKRCK